MNTLASSSALVGSLHDSGGRSVHLSLLQSHAACVVHGTSVFSQPVTNAQNLLAIQATVVGNLGSEVVLDGDGRVWVNEAL